MTALVCVCGHSAREHRRRCRLCRGKRWPCPFFMSNDATVEAYEKVVRLTGRRDVGTQVELFSQERAA